MIIFLEKVKILEFVFKNFCELKFLVFFKKREDFLILVGVVVFSVVLILFFVSIMVWFDIDLYVVDKRNLVEVVINFLDVLYFGCVEILFCIIVIDELYL